MSFDGGATWLEGNVAGQNIILACKLHQQLSIVTTWIYLVYLGVTLCGLGVFRFSLLWFHFTAVFFSQSVFSSCWVLPPYLWLFSFPLCMCAFKLDGVGGVVPLRRRLNWKKLAVAAAFAAAAGLSDYIPVLDPPLQKVEGVKIWNAEFRWPCLPEHLFCRGSTRGNKPTISDSLQVRPFGTLTQQHALVVMAAWPFWISRQN